MEYDILLYVLLMIVALCAGFIDIIAGGGGLINLPALLFTGMSPMTAFGTNKLQSAVCELSAVLHFRKKKAVNYAVITKALIWTAVGSILGTLLLLVIPIKLLEQLIPFLLTIVFIYFLLINQHKSSGTESYIKPNGKKFFILGNSIGFYNGFFGPATGSIWVVALMKSFKLNIKQATIYAKALNLVGNLSALVILIAGGYINFMAAFAMAIGSFTGGKLAAKFILYSDVKIIKLFFITLMFISIVAIYLKYFFKII